MREAHALRLDVLDAPQRARVFHRRAALEHQFPGHKRTHTECAATDTGTQHTTHNEAAARSTRLVINECVRHSRLQPPLQSIYL